MISQVQINDLEDVLGCYRRYITLRQGPMKVHVTILTASDH